MCLRCTHGCFCLHAPAYECAVPVCTCAWMSVDVCEHVCAHVYPWVLCVPMSSCVCVCACAPWAHVGARILCPHACRCDHRCGAGLSGRVKWKGQGPTSGSPRESMQGPPICRAPRRVSFPSPPPRHNHGNPQPPWLPGSPGGVGQSCQLGLWCNLPAEPLPELRVPLGEGKLPSATSPACLGASWGPGHTSHPMASPTGSRVGGQAMGEVPQWVPRPSWEAVDPAAPRLRQSCQQLRGRRWTRCPPATTMFGRKRSVSFGGFGWWVTDGRAGEGVERNLTVKPG